MIFRIFGILSALLDEISGDESCRSALSKCIAEKNIHDLTRICNQYEVRREYDAAMPLGTLRQDGCGDFRALRYLQNRRTKSTFRACGDVSFASRNSVC